MSRIDCLWYLTNWVREWVGYTSSLPSCLQSPRCRCRILFNLTTRNRLILRTPLCQPRHTLTHSDTASKALPYSPDWDQRTRCRVMDRHNHSVFLPVHIWQAPFFRCIRKTTDSQRSGWRTALPENYYLVFFLTDALNHGDTPTFFSGFTESHLFINQLLH